MRGGMVGQIATTTTVRFILQARGIHSRGTEILFLPLGRDTKGMGMVVGGMGGRDTSTTRHRNIARLRRVQVEEREEEGEGCTASQAVGWMIGRGMDNTMDGRRLMGGNRSWDIFGFQRTCYERIK